MLNLSVYKGEKRIFNFTIKDEDGNTIDLTGKQVKFRVMDGLPPAGTLVFSVDATNLGADGTCTVTLTETETDIEPKLYYYEIYVIYSGGEEYVAEIGIFQIKKRAEGTEGKTWIMPDEVRLKLKLDDDSMDDEEIQYIIEEAHRKVILDCGYYKIYKAVGKYPETDKTYYMPHGELIEVIQITHNGEIVDSDNYTVDKDSGKVIFNSDYDINSGDILIFKYVPKVYKDLEMLYSQLILSEMNYLQTGGEIFNVDSDKIKRQIEELKTKINSKATVGAVLDYGFRGRYTAGAVGWL